MADIFYGDDKDPDFYVMVHPGNPEKHAQQKAEDAKPNALSEMIIEKWALVPMSGHDGNFKPVHIYDTRIQAERMLTSFNQSGAIPRGFTVRPWRVRATRTVWVVWRSSPAGTVKVAEFKHRNEAYHFAENSDRGDLSASYRVDKEERAPELKVPKYYGPKWRLKTRRERRRYVR